MDNTASRANLVQPSSVQENLQPLALINGEKEPTQKEVEQEKAHMKTSTPPGKGNKALENLITRYMKQLSHIPLYTPDEELHYAKNIESLELHYWLLLIREPAAARTARNHLTNEQQELCDDITKLLTSYQRAIRRSKKAAIRKHPKRTELQLRISKALRKFDQDKYLIRAILADIRKSHRWPGGPSWISPISAETLLTFERAYGAATRARNNFARANLRLVISVAKRFNSRNLAFIDLIQEGNVGLLKAIHRFDHQKGFRFSTYAHWWIRQSIERAIINKGHQIRLPVHIIDTKRQATKAETRLQQKLGRVPTRGEIAQKIDMTEERLGVVLASIKPPPLSLNESYFETGPTSFLDLLRDNSATAIDEALIRENTQERVLELMQLLNPLERSIIQRRFGLTGKPDETLDDIGKSYNLSRERVRQIQVQGLAKMRRMCERRKISF